MSLSVSFSLNICLPNKNNKIINFLKRKSIYSKLVVLNEIKLLLMILKSEKPTVTSPVNLLSVETCSSLEGVISSCSILIQCKDVKELT